jgi:putative nucleotide binding protein
MKEEKCIILDFLPIGYPGRRHAEPIAQALGRNFSLLELVSRDGINLKPEEEVYIGEGKRDKIRYIRGVLDYQNMTTFAQKMLPEIVEKIVKEEEPRFVSFFNKATIVTPRMHQLELLPGVGKKHVMEIIEERRKRSFENFHDLAIRAKLTHPDKAVVKRILMELTGNEKYYMFTPLKRKEFAYS